MPKEFTADELIEAIATNGAGVLVITKKANEKVYKGARYMNGRFYMSPQFRSADGWFTFTDFVIGKGIADPNNKDDKRNEFEGTRRQLGTKISLAGKIGTAIAGLHTIWMQWVATSIADGTIVQGSRKVHGLIQDTLSETNTVAPGGAIADPFISFKLDFGNYPAGHPDKDLVGKPKTTIYDFSKPYNRSGPDGQPILDEKGVPKVYYQLATVIDPVTGLEVPVCEANMHLFITDNSVIRFGRITMGSVAISQGWISMPITLHMAVIEQGVAGGFDDGFSAPAANDIIRAAIPQVTTVTPDEVASAAAIDALLVAI